MSMNEDRELMPPPPLPPTIIASTSEASSTPYQLSHSYDNDENQSEIQYNLGDKIRMLQNDWNEQKQQQQQQYRQKNPQGITQRRIGTDTRILNEARQQGENEEPTTEDAPLDLDFRRLLTYLIIGGISFVTLKIFLKVGTILAVSISIIIFIGIVLIQNKDRLRTLMS